MWTAFTFFSFLCPLSGIVSLEAQKFLILVMSSLFIFSFIAHDFVSYLLFGVLICISLTNNIEHFSMCLLAIYISLVKCLFKSLLFCFYRYFVFLFLSCENSFYILDTSSLSVVLQIFIPHWWLVF